MNYITGALVVPIADVNGTPFITPRVLDLDTEILFPPTLFLLFGYLSLRSFFIDYRR